jgi:hypothetical protein
MLLNQANCFFETFGARSHSVRKFTHNIWANMRLEDVDHPNNHTLDLSADYIILDDSGENFTMIMIKHISNLAIYFTVFLIKKSLYGFL